jgi:hypothetical protein
MKVHRPLHVLLGAFLFVLSVGATHLFAVDGTDATSLLLLSSELSSSTGDELVRRAKFLGIPQDGSMEELRDRLYGHYGLNRETPSPDTVVESSGLLVKIQRADRLYSSGGRQGTLLLEGSTRLVFSKDPDSGETVLEADRIVVLFNHKTIVAMGSVRYEREGERMEDSLFGNMLAIRWEEGSLSLVDGNTSMIRENSEEGQVEFFTSGSRVTFTGDPRSIVFSDGMVTTNKEQAYFSLRAKHLLLVDGGDFFVENATISLGRIPMVWVPFLYYPGKTFVFNPVVGFDSTRGLFFSSSTELYGRYPKIEKGEQSSFTTLLSETPDGELVKDGWVYSPLYDGYEPSKLESWAGESGSYLVLLADAYRNNGVFVGLDSANSFLSKKVKLSAFGGLAFVGADSANFSTVYDIPPLRYTFNGTLGIDTKHVDVSLKMPFHSDPKVLVNYGNRLTSFALDALTGNATFPTTHQSDITRYDWDLSAKITIPTTVLAPYIDTLRIDKFESKVTWKANTLPDAPGYSIASMVIPDLQAYVEGTLVSLGKGAKENSDELEESDAPPFSIEELGIAPPYKVASATRKSTAGIDRSSLSLGYSMRQQVTDTDTIDNGAVVESSLYARTSGVLRLQGAIAPSLFTFEQRLEPLVSFNRSDTKGTRNLSLSSVTKASVVAIGLSYDLQAKLYQSSMNWSETGGESTTGGWNDWGDAVTRHELSWTWAFPMGVGRLTPSLVATLAPLPYGFKPKLTYAMDKTVVSITYQIQEDETGDFVGRDAVFSFSYKDTDFVEFSTVATYDTSLAKTMSNPMDPLLLAVDGSLHLLDSYLEVTGKASYDVSEEKFSSFSTSVALPWIATTLQGHGTLGKIELTSLDTEVSLDGFERSWWKNRIRLGLDVLGSYRHSFVDKFASRFSLGIELDFKIEQFLTVDISFTSVNKGFHTYDGFSDVWEDLLRSFDFFGDGRKSTQFTMDSVAISVIHHMADWDLHCKYGGSVVLSDMEWQWKPVFSIFLQWKAIPEIKVEREFDVDS